MPIPVTCRCGSTYNLRDEYAGQVVQCPKCAARIELPAAPVTARQPQADPVFDRDVFLLRQKHLAISEKYMVGDEQNRPILFVQRPVYLARGCLAMLAAVLAFFVVGIAALVLAALMPHDALRVVCVVLGILGAIAAVVVVLVALQP
ncbi:MAG: hypothetical protein NUV77_26805, partial [Thermoguttaceae bacterium]|nr:hypothetical protein [Thermoguttaceae bacterium]